MTQQPDPVLFEARSGIAFITLNRPQVHNAVDERTRVQLSAALSRAASDLDIGVAVLTGSGTRAFCAGMDLREFAATPMSAAARKRQRRERANPLALFSKPVIAAVNGFALGLGLELVLQCDIVVASSSASFALAEVRRGLIPGAGGTQRLARRIGQGRAMEMTLTGRTVGADDALAYGLVEYVVAPEDLMAKTESIAREILANAPMAVQLAKEAVKRGLEMPLADGLRLEDDLVVIVTSTEDAREGPLAFAEKRLPQWRGR